jgi:hypothetical protein
MVKFKSSGGPVGNLNTESEVTIYDNRGHVASIQMTKHYTPKTMLSLR